MEETSRNEVWRVLSEQVFEEMDQWRKQHPRATFQAIEEELDVRLSRVRAQMLVDLAHESDKRDWSGQEEEVRPRCPSCGSGFQARGQHERSLQTHGGQRIPLTRTYGTCPHCGSGFFPPG